MARIALGVSGGIGAYKAVEVVRGLQQAGHDVTVVMTRSARRFVGELTFEAITRHRVIGSQWTPGLNADIEHIALATASDLLLVVPATANVIAKFAHGIADDFLSSLYLATTAPVLLAPAMNTHMLAHPAVRANLETLSARGVRFVEPGEGYLACGWVGKGRLAEPGEVVAAAGRLLGGGRARWARGPGHRRPDLRGHRSGALRRQPLERPHGLRSGARGVAAGRGGGARHRTDAPRSAAWRRRRARPQRRRHASGGDGPRRGRRCRGDGRRRRRLHAASGGGAEGRQAGRRLVAAAGPHHRHPRRPRRAAVAGRRARPCSSGSPPRPTTCSPMPTPSAAARASTSSSPTTCRGPMPGSRSAPTS